MAIDESLKCDRFPRATRYNPEWLLAGVGGGANSLWLTEWLCEGLDLQPGMRVLDLGCGRGLSSIFLSREFDVEVWATDLWFSASENRERIRDAGVEDRVFPIAANAKALPFSTEFFDAIVSIDSFMFYGTDDLYMNYLARFLKPGGQVGIALAGLTNEIGEEVPEHLREWWAGEVVHCLHSAEWWQNHWTRSRAVDVTTADTLADGWQLWRDWMKIIAPDNTAEIETVEQDAGRHLGYVRTIARRRENALLFDPILAMPEEYTAAPLLRDA